MIYTKKKYKVPLVSSTFYEEKKTLKKLSSFVLNSKKLSMGNSCLKFEKEFAKFHNSKHATLFNSGGSANLAMIQALLNLNLLKRNDKVGFSAITWSTNVMPILQLGLKPVPLEIDLDYLNVTSDEILDKIKKYNLKAIFITNILGHCGDMKNIAKVCKDNKVILFEDNCESLGTTTNKKLLGTYGLMSSSSFYVAHHISTIEGGMVVTGSDKVDEQLKLIRANGWDRNLTKLQKKRIRKKNKIYNEFEAKYTFYDLGYNLRPTEITGFLGCLQIKVLKKIINERERNYFIFQSIINKKKQLHKIKVDHIEKLSSFAIPMIFKTPKLRNKYIKIFQKNGIEIRPLIAGNIEKQPFFNKYIKEKFNLKITKKIDDCGFYFGNYPQLNSNQISIIKKCLSKIE